MAGDERIRERAYQIWLSEGKPLGRDAEHWERARQQIARDIERGAAAHNAGTNDVPESNVVVHRGATSGSPTPGFEPLDGLNTPGVKARRT